MRTVVRRWRALMPHPRVYEIWRSRSTPGAGRALPTNSRGVSPRRPGRQEEDPDGVVLGYVDVGPLLSLAQDLSLVRYCRCWTVSPPAYLPADRSPEASGFVENLRQLKLLMRRHGGESRSGSRSRAGTFARRPGRRRDAGTLPGPRRHAGALRAGARLSSSTCVTTAPDQPGREDYGMFYNTDPQRVWGPTSVAPRPAAAAHGDDPHAGGRSLPGEDAAYPFRQLRLCLPGPAGPALRAVAGAGPGRHAAAIRGDAVQVTDLMGTPGVWRRVPGGCCAPLAEPSLPAGRRGVAAGG